MALILREKDAADWVYRGEGAANLVLGYVGSSPSFIGKVLRVLKAQRDEEESVNDEPLLSEHECLLWKETKELVACVSKEISGQVYVMHVMTPLLGAKYVDAGSSILVSKEFLELIEKNVLTQRPSWRVDAAKVNTLCDSALLMSDLSVFSHGSQKENFCVAVEIKPKCGFLPSSRFIAERNAIKQSVTRFRMHQYLKLHDKLISRISEYDPINLFSGSKAKVIQAIRSLVTNPQNNLRVFLNSSLVFGTLGGGVDDMAASDMSNLSRLLENVLQADHGQHLDCFIELIAELIIRSGVLGQLLLVQKLDRIDIEGAIHAYYNIISEPCMLCSDLCDAKLQHQYSYLHSLSLEESLKTVREYLIAATAKDCSLMISIRPRNDVESDSGYSSVFLESTKQNFDYKAFFIDLDRKPLRKMAYYYELDQRIVNYYKQIMRESEANHENVLGIIQM